MELRIGVAGTGIHGRRYVEHLLAGEVAGARLGGICRANADAGRAFAREHGVVFHPTVTELAADPGIDLLVAALPAARHEEAALAGIDAGKPTLIEKPLAATAAAARRVADRVAETGAFLMVAQTLRFDPLLQRLRDLIDSLGDLQMITINQRFEPATRSWLDRPDGGGVFLNTGVHGFDLIRWLSGSEVESVTATSRSETTAHTEDQAVAVIRLTDGRLALLDNARSTQSRSGRVELIGADAQLWGDHIHRTLERVEGRERTALGPIPAQPTVPRTLTALVEAVTTDGPSPIPATEGLAAVEVVEAARLSARDDRRVTLEEIRRASRSTESRLTTD